MPEVTIIEKKELESYIELVCMKAMKDAVEIAVRETLKTIGIKPKDIDPSITQNAAVKMMKEAGCKKNLPALRKAMFDGRVRWEKKDMDNPRGRVMVKQKDVLKLINQ